MFRPYFKINIMDIKVGDLVESDYGKGEVVAVTDQWFIHNDSLNKSNSEFALLYDEDWFRKLLRC